MLLALLVACLYMWLVVGTNVVGISSLLILASLLASLLSLLLSACCHQWQLVYGIGGSMLLLLWLVASVFVGVGMLLVSMAACC